MDKPQAQIWDRCLPLITHGYPYSDARVNIEDDTVTLTKQQQVKHLPNKTVNKG